MKREAVGRAVMAVLTVGAVLPGPAIGRVAALALLRARLRLMDPTSPRTMEGYEILGRAELTRGHLPEAAEAWKTVLAQKFDPTLAVQTAEGMYEAAQKMTPEALAMFKRALAEAPADAPWRPMARKRIAEAGG